MSDTSRPKRPPASASEDERRAERVFESAQTRSASFRPAYADKDLLPCDELRPTRMQLEFLEPRLTLGEGGVHATIVVLGSPRSVAPELARDSLRALTARARATRAFFPLVHSGAPHR